MKITVVLAGLLALAACGWAESQSCLAPDLMVTDGRIVSSNFEGSANGFNPTYWYAFYGQAGHSYSVEFVATTDNESSNLSINFVNLTVWGPNDISGLRENGCRGATTLSLIATQAFTPTLARTVSGGVYGTGQRTALVQPASGIDIVAVTNSQGAGGYSYRVVDTTLFNARWSTWTGYDTQWGFTNTSDMPITGTLSIYETSAHLLWSGTISVAPGGQVFRSSAASDLNLPRNDAGYAIFSHTGPPQAIIADSYMLNGNATVVVYTKFETRNSQ